MSKVGERMRMRRQALGYSGEYVGKMLGVDKTTVYRYEKGEIEKLPISIIRKLARILQTNPEYLMGWSDDDEKTSGTDEVFSENARAVARKYDGMTPKNQKLLENLLAAMQNDDEDDE